MPKSRVRKTRGQGRIQHVGSDGCARNVTTYPFQRKDKRTGKQYPVSGIRVNGLYLS